MSFHFTYDDARESARRAQRLLDGADGLNWVPDELSTAFNRAIDAWLYDAGEKTGPSNQDSLIRFLKVAPEGIRHDASRLSHQLVLLEIQLMGDPSDLIETLPLSDWKEAANRLLTALESLIDKLQNPAPETDL